jgi:hypothetical protein
MGQGEEEEGKNLLKAAGTPMMRPLPVSSLLSETLLPGESSIKAMSGIESPTLTMVAAEAWNERVVRGVVVLRIARRDKEVTRERAVINMAIGEWGDEGCF